MSKKTTYLFSAIVFVLFCFAGWFFYQSQVAKKVISPEILTVTESVVKAQSGVSSAVGKTNPFGADVNPMQGYKNPFE